MDSCQAGIASALVQQRSLKVNGRLTMQRSQTRSVASQRLLRLKVIRPASGHIPTSPCPSARRAWVVSQRMPSAEAKAWVVTTSPSVAVPAPPSSTPRRAGRRAARL